ncbi:MAG: hypothetical protein R3286_00525, partial [Gammaproteobacteria bacterium]|nr:hypothetical protein [Gammaproteobacteria bacterium]
QAPLELAIAHALHGAWRVTLHEWRPDGGPYAGLPVDAEEARARRDARCVLEPLAVPPAVTTAPPPGAAGEHVVDLRWR